MNPNRAISLRELAFVRDVLIPRAWVQGPEVDELLHLRGKIEGIFSALQQEQAPEAPQPADESEHPQAAAPERQKKPRHPKKRRGQQPHPRLDGS